jgi:hypothetical protein
MHSSRPPHSPSRRFLRGTPSATPLTDASQKARSLRPRAVRRMRKAHTVPALDPSIIGPLSTPSQGTRA